MAGYALCSTSMTVLVSQVIDAFRLANAQQGLMNSMIQLGSAVSVLLMPFMQGRLKKTVVFTCSIALQILSLLFIGFSGAFFTLAVACLLLGAAGGWTDGYANALIVDIHQENSAKYMGMLHGFYSVGAILAPVIIQGLLLLMAWRNVYLALAGISLLVALFFAFVARRSRALFRASSGGETPLKPALVLAHIKDKYNLCIMVCMLLYSASQFGFTAWVVRYMAVRFGSESLGSLGLLLFWICTAASRFLTPRLYMQPLKMVTIGTGLAGILVLLGIFSGNVYLMVVASALNGLLSGFCMPLIIHEAVGRYPGNTSLPSSIIILTSRVAMVLIPLVVGAAAVASLQLSMALPALFSLATMGSGLLAMHVKNRG
ncbi:MFS transporter [Clostridia bacterium OttesenSCG-928-O13]|nr:MFS transporter [Clostridia bacterium OttesenSCG-928-O13]